MGAHRLSELQRRIIDYCFDVIANDGETVSSKMIADALGLSQGNLGYVLRTLQWNRFLIIEKGSGSGGGGIAIAIHGVRHPDFGEARCEAVVFDERLGVYVFASEKSAGEIVVRSCLTCHSVFEADGRFLRLCPDCRAEVTEAASESTGGYQSNSAALIHQQIGGFERPDKVALRRIHWSENKG